MRVPKPESLGFSPAKFPSWRKDQPDAIIHGLTSEKRYVGQVQKQGSGKSLTAMAQAVLSSDSRTMILTATKGLEKQYTDDFESVGLISIMGRSNYTCGCDTEKTCEEGGIGGKCRYKGSTLCTFSARKQELLDSRFGITNYSFWMSCNKYGIDLGLYDMLICDEAHNIPDILNRSMQVQLSSHEVNHMLKWQWPDHRDIGDRTTCMEHWRVWALQARQRACIEVQELEVLLSKSDKPSRKLIGDYKQFKNLVRKLADIATCHPSKWVSDTYAQGYQFDPIDASEYAERVLFHGIEKIILTSGTIRPRTLKMLGIPEEDFEFHDYPVEILAGKSPFIYVPTVKVDRRTTEEEYDKLVETIDEIIEAWAEHKGIIHTSSFKLRDLIMERSRMTRYMITNYQDGEPTTAVIERFKLAKPPCVLVSPSVTTGYDFPHDCARYNVIAKIPFPDERSKVDQARKEADPQRGAYRAMQDIVQAFGRADRADDDWQVCICLDRNWEWFRWKYMSLAPVWFPAYIRKSATIPEPPDVAELVRANKYGNRRVIA